MTMRSSIRNAVLITLLFQTFSALAAVSRTYADWGSGPAQWLMTRDEEKKWKSIDNDKDAQAFIDLFWARRDPTPGTFENEYRDEFDSRVKFTDEQYTDRSHRGALTDRGRAIIVLGWPTNMNKNLAHERSMNTTEAAMGDSQSDRGSGDRARGSRLGAKDEWIYEKADAQKYGLPRIEIVFIQDPISGIVQRDPQRHDMMAAVPVAIEKAIVSRNLTEAPPWSKQPPTKVEFVPVAKGGPAVPSTRKAVDGAHALMLVKDPSALPNPQGPKDPLAGAVSVSSFPSGTDLGYVFEYCGNAETIKTTIAIHGTGASKVNMVAPTDEVPIEAVRTLPGCGIVRASIPLGDMKVAPGTYTFSLKVEDGPKVWELAQDFKVE